MLSCSFFLCYESYVTGILMRSLQFFMVRGAILNLPVVVVGKFDSLVVIIAHLVERIKV